MNRVIRTTDIVPLTYFFRTRYSRFGAILMYLLLGLGLPLLAVYFSRLPQGASEAWKWSCRLLFLWPAHAALYELGYFMNDSWAFRREKARGLTRCGESYFTLAGSRRLLAIACISRIVFAALWLLLAASFIPFGTLAAAATIVAGTLAIFTLHNLLLPPYRIATFALLYVGRYFMAVPFFGPDFSHGVYWLIAASIIAAYTWGYAAKKLWRRPFQTIRGNPPTVIRLPLAIAAIAAVTNVFMPIGDGTFFVWAACYLFCLDALFSIGMLAKAVFRLRGRHRTRYHFHTRFSHDCELDFPELAWLARRKKLDRVYITDHKQDVGPAEFAELQTKCLEYSQRSGVAFLPGIEYDVCHQHVLALNLSQYIEIDPAEARDLERLHLHCEQLVWAHPIVGYRCCVRPSYLRNLWRIAARVHGMELVNAKSFRQGRQYFRQILLCVAFAILLPPVRLYRGEDAHSAADWGEIHLPGRKRRSLSISRKPAAFDGAKNLPVTVQVHPVHGDPPPGHAGSPINSCQIGVDAWRRAG